MCGIAGIVWKSEKSVSLDKFRYASRLIKHRGPDAYDEFFVDGVFLAHFRLAIIDQTNGGKQPYYSRAKPGDVGVYNGELYNHNELEIEHAIDRKTRSDTEIFFESIGLIGTEALRDFNGIFAFGLLTSQRNKLILGRDRFGVKPLYYVDCPDFFAFASEAKVLYEYMEVLEINPRVVHEFFRFGSSMSNDTIVKGVKKVPPGHLLTYKIKEHTFVLEPFWEINDANIAQPSVKIYEDAVCRTKHLLNRAVERQCISDVPIGAYLSGGLDSSLVVAFSARAIPGKLKTFSVDFEGAENSELPLARAVARTFGTDHHEFRVSAKSIEHEMVNIVFQYDEPFADPAALPLYLMGRESSQFSTVVLQGDGGDEVFGGYGRHLDASQFRRRRLAFGLLQYIHPKNNERERFRKRFMSLSKKPAAERLAEMACRDVSNELMIILKGGFLERVVESTSIEAFRRSVESIDWSDELSRSLSVDTMTILPNTFLEKVDKISMMHSLEARVPFLDNELFDYVSRLPSEFKVNNGITKRILRDIGKEMLPTDVVDGRKVSFGTPIGEWLRTSLANYTEDILSESKKYFSFYFNFDGIERLKKEHFNREVDHSAILWRLIVFLTWLSIYKNKILFADVGRRMTYGKNAD